MLTYVYAMAGLIGGILTVVVVGQATGYLLPKLGGALVFLLSGVGCGLGGRALTHRLLLGHFPALPSPTAVAGTATGVAMMLIVLDVDAPADRTLALLVLGVLVQGVAAVTAWRREPWWQPVLLDQVVLTLMTLSVVGTGALLTVYPGAFLPLLLAVWALGVGLWLLRARQTTPHASSSTRPARTPRRTTPAR